ncbi:MAG: branched-chain amino acid transport system II carrier protein, partial [Flavobacteriaceae bacterium]
IVYAALILTGASLQGKFDDDMARTALLNGISLKTLGNSAQLLLAILVSLACFTTAVGIVTGAADFVQSRFNHSRKAYLVTAVIGCVLGVLMGQLNVDHIIAVAVPALMFIYPVTIVLILLNVLPERYAPSKTFRAVVLTTLVFSIPDFLGSLGLSIQGLDWIPLAQHHLGWMLPALVVFLGSHIFLRKQES